MISWEGMTHEIHSLPISIHDGARLRASLPPAYLCRLRARTTPNCHSHGHRAFFPIRHAKT